MTHVRFRRAPLEHWPGQEQPRSPSRIWPTRKWISSPIKCAVCCVANMIFRARGNSGSWTLVSCRQRTSGRCSFIQARTRARASSDFNGEYSSEAAIAIVLLVSRMNPNNRRNAEAAILFRRNLRFVEATLLVPLCKVNFASSLDLDTGTTHILSFSTLQEVYPYRESWGNR